MSPKIMVFHLRELIYTFVFIVLGILLIFLLVAMFKNKDSKDTASASGEVSVSADVTNDQYVPGVYTSSITLNDASVEVKVSVDANHINDIELENISESVTTMYPLMEESFDDLEAQILDKQSLDEITYKDGSKYTYTILYDAINLALDKAVNEGN